MGITASQWWRQEFVTLQDNELAVSKIWHPKIGFNWEQFLGKSGDENAHASFSTLTMACRFLSKCLDATCTMGRIMAAVQVEFFLQVLQHIQVSFSITLPCLALSKTPVSMTEATPDFWYHWELTLGNYALNLPTSLPTLASMYCTKCRQQ